MKSRERNTVERHHRTLSSKSVAEIRKRMRVIETAHPPYKIGEQKTTNNVVKTTQSTTKKVIRR